MLRIFEDRDVFEDDIFEAKVKASAFRGQ